MTRFVEANRYYAKHTGKSGYVAQRPAPKPLPYGLAEEAGSAFYPEYRQFIPKDYRKYSDSYIDLRNKPYREWYDKWGKPTINRYLVDWRKKYYAIQKALRATQNSKSSNVQYSTFSKYNGTTVRNKSGSTYCRCNAKSKRRRFYGKRKNFNGQTKRRGQRFQNRSNYLYGSTRTSYYSQRYY